MYRAACVAKLTRLADVKGPIMKPDQEDMDYVNHAHAKIMMLTVQVSYDARSFVLLVSRGKPDNLS